MSLSRYQLSANEQHILRVMKISKNWVWKDKCILYKIKERKLIPPDLNGYIELSNIVSKKFMKNFVKCECFTIPKGKRVRHRGGGGNHRQWRRGMHRRVGEI